MKNLYILLILAFSTSIAQAQTRSLNRFINHHKVQENALAVSVPGWMFDLAGFSSNFIDEEDSEAREILKLTNKIKRVRVLIIEEHAKVESKDVKKLIDGLKRDKFEELITVKSEGTLIKLMIKEKRDQIRNITAFIQDDETMFLLTLSGKFKLEDIRNLEMWKELDTEDLFEI